MATAPCVAVDTTRRRQPTRRHFFGPLTLGCVMPAWARRTPHHFIPPSLARSPAHTHTRARLMAANNRLRRHYRATVGMGKRRLSKLRGLLACVSQAQRALAGHPRWRPLNQILVLHGFAGGGVGRRTHMDGVVGDGLVGAEGAALTMAHDTALQHPFKHPLLIPVGGHHGAAATAGAAAAQRGRRHTHHRRTWIHVGGGGGAGGGGGGGNGVGAAGNGGGIAGRKPSPSAHRGMGPLNRRRRRRRAGSGGGGGGGDGRRGQATRRRIVPRRRQQQRQ